MVFCTLSYLQISFCTDPIAKNEAPTSIDKMTMNFAHKNFENKELYRQ